VLIVIVMNEGVDDMAAQSRRHEVISVSLPRERLHRADEVIPRARRSRVIAAVLTTFLDSVAQKEVAEEYAAYYGARRSDEARAECDLLEEWRPSDEEAWAILDRETRRARRPAR
jgi:metal-responsive CopG/Arc/MetJ family transcriptional regulator